MHRGARAHHVHGAGLVAQWSRLPGILRVLIIVLAAWLLVGIFFLISTPFHSGSTHETDEIVPFHSGGGKIVNVQVKPTFKMGAGEDFDHMRGRPPLPHGRQPEPWWNQKRCYHRPVPEVSEMVGRFFFAHADRSEQPPAENSTVLGQVVDAIKGSWSLFSKKDGFPEVDIFYPGRGRGRGRGGLFLTEAMDTLLVAKLHPELRVAMEWISENANYDLVCGAGGLVQPAAGDEAAGDKKSRNGGGGNNGGQHGDDGGDDDKGGADADKHKQQQHRHDSDNRAQEAAALVPLQLASSATIASLLSLHFGTFKHDDLRHENDVSFLRRAMHIVKRIEQSTHSSTAIVRDLGLFLLEGMPVGSCCTAAAEECLGKGLQMSSNVDRSKQQQQQRHAASVDASLGATLQELRMVSIAASEFKHTAEERELSAQLSTKLEEFTFGLLGATASCTVETKDDLEAEGGGGGGGGPGAGGGNGEGAPGASGGVGGALAERLAEKKKEFIGRIRKSVNCKQLLQASMDFILDGSCGLGAAALRSWASCKNLGGCTVPGPGSQGSGAAAAGSFDARPTLIVLWNEIAKAIMRASKRFGPYIVPLGSLTNGVLDISECSMPGVFAQSFIETGNQCHLRFAQETIETCFALYEKMPTGLAPALANFASPTDPHGADIKAVDPVFQLDQATGMFESLFYLFRATRNPRYRQMASDIWESIQNVAMANDDRFAGVADVTVVPTALEGYKIIDEMPPRWIGGTLKYLYLIFSPESTMDLHSWILNCRGHAMPRESTL